MALFSFAFIFVGSISFALGFIHLLIFVRRRELKVDLAFSCMAFAIAFSSFFELWAFKADTLTDYIPRLKATLVVQAFLWIFFAWFVKLYTRAVKLWPPILVTVLYSIALVINIVSPGGILFTSIDELTTFTLSSGDILNLGNGPPNPLRIIADIGWIILLIYTAVASIDFAQRENRKKAITFASTIFLCLGLG